MPGTLILEAMAQLGGCYQKQVCDSQNSHALLVTVDKAKLRRQVRPGDKIGLECRSVVVHVDGQLVA
jgi:3-hydroxyacyl-[acyl-carrier-protein] dehydratase